MFARKWRPGYVITIGLVVQVFGYVLFTQLDAGTGLALVIASFVIVYPGVAPAMALTTDLVVSSVPPVKAGGASGLATTVNDLGISLGIAVIGSVGVVAYRSQIADTLPDGLPADAAAAASDSIDGALVSATELPAALGQSLAAAAQEAFTSGLNAAALVSAVIVGVAAIISATQLRHVPRTGSVPTENTPETLQVK